MATYTVLNTDSTGAASLRDALDQANAAPGADTIDFAAGVTGTIQLTGTSGFGELNISDALTIAGPGADKLTIIGEADSPVVIVNDESGDSNIEITGLTLTGGKGFQAGGIVSLDDNLHLSGVVIAGNTGTGAGGLYFAGVGGYLLVENSTISNNTGRNVGGVQIDFLGTPALFVNTTIANNVGTGGGGGFARVGGVLATATSNATFQHVTIAGNTGQAGPSGLGAVSGSVLTLQNSIVSNVTNGVGDIGVQLGGAIVANSTLIRANLGVVLGGGSANNFTGDPRLSALGQNGGGVPTMAPGLRASLGEGSEGPGQACRSRSGPWRGGAAALRAVGICPAGRPWTRPARVATQQGAGDQRRLRQPDPVPDLRLQPAPAGDGDHPRGQDPAQPLPARTGYRQGGDRKGRRGRDERRRRARPDGRHGRRHHLGGHARLSVLHRKTADQGRTGSPHLLAGEPH